MFFWRDDVAGIRRAFTDRSGGVSEAPYAGLNLGGHVGDAAAAVRENRSRVAAGMGVEPERLVLIDQCHGADVAERYRRPEDELLLFVDTAAVLIGVGAVDELVHQLSAVGDTTRQVELVRQLWRVESSSTEPVLTALAGAAPAPVSKAARKALHSLRSARR